MDELVIGEKKYVSSKRAAELTGYAKDYVGQLCREGRVEARLVGRSWYILETSILEHRFGEKKNGEEHREVGSSEEPQEIEEPASLKVEVEIESEWKSPTYTAESISPLPELIPEPKIEIAPAPRSSLNLLSRDSQTFAPPTSASYMKEPGEQEGEVAISIHKMSQESPVKREEPVMGKIEFTEAPRRRRQARRGSVIGSAVIVAVSVIAVAIMLIGTGTMDGNNSLFFGEKSSIVNFLGGKSFYKK